VADKIPPSTSPAAKRGARPGKKTWQPPRIRSGRLFESNSLACGKNGPGLEGCEQMPKVS
jgi:hypothetical protein